MATRHDVEWHFSGQITVVTGGSTGIGRAISEAFVAAGCEVWIASLPGPEMEEARGASSLRGAHFVACDVSDDTQVARLFSEIDRLNNVVQCAGIIARGRCTRVTGATAWVEAIGYEDDPENPACRAYGTYMLFKGEPMWQP